MREIQPCQWTGKNGKIIENGRAVRQLRAEIRGRGTPTVEQSPENDETGSAACRVRRVLPAAERLFSFIGNGEQISDQFDRSV